LGEDGLSRVAALRREGLEVEVVVGRHHDGSDLNDEFTASSDLEDAFARLRESVKGGGKVK
jgi:hypothetical protein